MATLIAGMCKLQLSVVVVLFCQFGKGNIASLIVSTAQHILLATKRGRDFV
jgi:hypothetical protein